MMLKSKIKGLVMKLIKRLSRPIVLRLLAPEIALLKTICAELKLETEILSQEVSEIRGQQGLTGLSAADRRLITLYKQVTPRK